MENLCKTWCKKIYNIKKSGITYVCSHNYAKIKVDFYDSLPLGKLLTLPNAILLISKFLIKIKITIILINS